MIITLDGYSASGKSTLAKKLANRLNFNCLNTGMIYRAITAFLLENKISINNLEISKILDNIRVDVLFKNNNQFVYINNKDYTKYINDKNVQNNVANYSSILTIRELVKSIQHVIAQNNDIVIEGRDIGTHIFPNADFKFFIECDMDIRTKRRLEDLNKSGFNLTFEEVKDSLIDRDYKDTTRKYGPLVKPDNAIVIDTSNLSINECIETMLAHIKWITVLIKN